MDTGTTATPARGTRPRNRRELILAAARELFYRRGYANVAMSDIAEAVAIGPSALYRHFRGKQELLHAVVDEAVDSCLGGLFHAPAGDLDALVGSFAASSLGRRELGVLWQREARHLPAEQHAELAGRVHAARTVLVEQLTAHRPELDPARAELLAWSVLGIAVSIGYQHVELPGPQYRALLATLMRRIGTADLPAVGDRPVEGPADAPALTHRSRRESLLSAATGLFAQRGYAVVSLEETGAAVGIAGPSIYHHFASKTEILATALNRSAERLYLDVSEVLTASPDAAGALSLLVRRYAEFALAHRHLVALIVTETEHLPEEEQARIRQVQRDYIEEWLHLLRTVHPTMPAEEARVRVQAVLTVVNDVARTPRLRGRPGLGAGLHRLGCDLLDVETC
ncbi:TetR/AcrR family transcriptional regulator [Streptacidiphilus jiangxiensis]|uniref:DNA-binding transcriptional regulator, AcrR family n=1 Tax=Streptacidiphilus jiangxiensis TaxID=235985 RepID=A0A1H7TKG2_STRJI|nr:TetR/AcrR family transcriptional regulator [Streptacidiphilus jiangxiensis]SEL84894.1 DNA-binding transcriptional regulator, AcrR family [Streptacidiphilus jiangxiensis]